MLTQICYTISTMSGHSKWATIKRAKGAADAKKGMLFTKLGKNISMAVKTGGGADPAFNFKLRMAIDKAREAAMPNENIDRAIKKGTGMGREAIEEVTYEGYGPAGSAFIVEAVTDNSNRTLQSIRNIFTKNGGHIGGQGSVAWMFGSDMKPQQNIEPSKEDLVKIQDLVDKLTEEEDVVNVHTNL